MAFYDSAAWGVIFGLALMLVGGLVLWAYGARRDRTTATSLTISGPEAEATRLFHTKLTRWFFVYGYIVIGLGLAILLISSAVFVKL